MTLASKDVVKQLTEFPPFPKVASKLLSLLQEDDIGAREIADLISADPGMTTKVIRMSNSPFYMLSQPVECIQDAIIVLGFETLKNIALGVSIQKGLNQYVPATRYFDMTAFWRHSFATAIAGHKLDSNGASETSSKLYLAGLVHDIGKLFQGYYWPEAWKGMIKELRISQASFSELERKYFSLTHMEISTELCESWSFSPKIIELLQELKVSEICQLGQISSPLVIANAAASLSGCPFPIEGAHKENLCQTEQHLSLAENILDDVNYQLRILST